MTQYTLAEMVAAGFTKRGIRLWDTAGLLGPVERNPRNERIFTPEHLRRAKIIAAAQSAGWTLARIRGFLASPTAEETFNLGSDLHETAMNLTAVRELLALADPNQPAFDL